MRSPNLGSIKGISEQCSREESLDVFRKISHIRHFELCAKDAFDAKVIKMPIYLSVGQEAVAVALSFAYPNPHIFATHRCHDYYLAYGGNPTALADELLHLPSGCAKGMGGSASIQFHTDNIRMFGHDGFIGTQAPIGVGYTLATGKNCLIVAGDAAWEEDYAIAAMGYAAHKKAPVLFIGMDNGLSILTKTEVRRNWKIADIARAFGMPAVEIADDPWLVMHHARELSSHLPAYLNVQVVRHLWHNNTGTDGPPEWDRYVLVKEELHRLGLHAQTEEIEKKAKGINEALWHERRKVQQESGIIV
jgi:TPP-dependent pyruvate/acetoin dehydrogenase alpha subunit